MKSMIANRYELIRNLGDQRPSKVRVKIYVQPIILIPKEGKEVVYFLPQQTIIRVREGDEVTTGSILGRVPQESSGTKDITGWSPPCRWLIWSASSKRPCGIMAEMSGTSQLW